MENFREERHDSRLFVDLDGTLAEFRTVDTLETLYEKNYFFGLEPQNNVVEAIRCVIREHPEIDVYILSAVLTDSKYALTEKNAWIDKYLPEIDQEHRIFPPCGASKKDFIDGGVTQQDFLLDDYSMNLNEWEPPARGIKLMNGINGTKGTWQSERISMDRNAEEMAEKIVNVIKGVEHVMDRGPGQNELYIGNDIEYKQDTLDWLLEKDDHYKYMILSRMEENCKYFNGGGHRSQKELWGGTPEAHIFYMKSLYNSFAPDKKPTWITPEQIYQYQNDLCSDFEVESAALTHDGYATAEVQVCEYKNGHKDVYQTEAYFRISDPVNGQGMELVNIDEDLGSNKIFRERWEELEKLVKEKVIQAQVYEAFMDIAHKAKSDTLRVQNPWGAWLGRIVNEQAVEQYFDISITGIQTTNEYLMELQHVKGTNVEASTHHTVSFDPADEKSIDLAVNELFSKAKSFFTAEMPDMDMDGRLGMQLYSPHTERTLEQHYSELQKLGYEPIASYDTDRKKETARPEIINFNRHRGR